MISRAFSILLSALNQARRPQHRARNFKEYQMTFSNPRTSFKTLSAALLCLALFVPQSLWAQGGFTKGKATKGVVVPTTAVVPPTTVGQIFISELRLAGPNGVKDEFIELFNNTDAPLLVQAADASPGLGIAASDGVVRCI